jgi:hypothetical protein
MFPDVQRIFILLRSLRKQMGCAVHNEKYKAGQNRLPVQDKRLENFGTDGRFLQNSKALTG